MIRFDDAFLSALREADNFIVSAHVHPDGDAVGSMLAMVHLLRRMGKTAAAVLSDPPPQDLRLLPEADSILTPADAAGIQCDAFLAVDVSEKERLGEAAALFDAAPQTLQLDHHPTNPAYAQWNAVFADAAASGEIVAALYEALGVALDAVCAPQLYCAIYSDTGGFCFNSVTDWTFECMRRLMVAGLDVALWARNLFTVRRRPSVAVLGRALASMRFFADGQATCMHITQRDMERCGAQREHAEGVVNYGLYMDGVRMSFYGIQDGTGYKVSIRALPPCSAAVVAARFGGGGHVLAAGCRLEGDWASVRGKLARACLEQLKA